MKRYIVWTPDLWSEEVQWEVSWETDELSEAVALWEKASGGYRQVLLTEVIREYLDT